jgi:hypothetical protein
MAERLDVLSRMLRGQIERVREGRSIGSIRLGPRRDVWPE